MQAGWLSNIGWVLAIAAIAAAGVAWSNHAEAETCRRVMADGVLTSAAIDGGENRSGRKSNTGYFVHAVWTDAAGAERAESIPISAAYAAKITSGDYLLIDKVDVRYLAGEHKVRAVVAEDGPQRIADREAAASLGAATATISLMGAAILLFLGRRKASAAARA